MWYISDIKLLDVYNDVALHKSYHYHNVKFQLTRLVVDIRNTEFKQEISLVAKRGSDNFIRDMQMYKPYGWCPGGYDPGDCMLCVIDRPSMEFLDCIESVRVVDKDISEDFKAFCMSLRPGFSFWDEWKTIVDCSSAFIQMAFPLFQAVCFLKKGWRGDKFYLRGRTDLISCIEFSDLHKAKAMLAKAAVKGYNPMIEDEDVKSKLCNGGEF